MNKKLILMIFSLVCAIYCPAGAQSPPPPSAATQPGGLTVAILDFSADVPGDDDLGKQIGEALTAMLSDQPGLILVDRATLARTLQEHELNLTGLVDTSSAVQVGKIVGAKLMVTGKAFALDDSIFITAKIIGTETSLVDGVLVKGKHGDDLGDLIMQLSDKLQTRIRTSGPKLIASDDPIDPLPAIKARLDKLTLPRIDIEVAEQFISSPRVIDPPARTELRKMFTDCGFTVIDPSEVTPEHSGVKFIVKGEGISEFAAKIGNLVTCSARLEVTVVNFADGTIVFSDRITTRAVDLSEVIAGRTALQKAAHAMGLQILSRFADILPPK